MNRKLKVLKTVYTSIYIQYKYFYKAYIFLILMIKTEKNLALNAKR